MFREKLRTQEISGICRFMSLKGIRKSDQIIKTKTNTKQSKQSMNKFNLALSCALAVALISNDAEAMKLASEDPNILGGDTSDD